MYVKTMVDIIRTLENLSFSIGNRHIDGYLVKMLCGQALCKGNIHQDSIRCTQFHKEARKGEFHL